MHKILFICATHGDEAFSVEVLQQLEKEFPKKEYGYDWIIGNPKALQEGVRYTESDLNRSAPGNLNSSIYEERRAAKIIELAAGYDIVIDIHGAKPDCGIVKIIPYPTADNIKLAKSIPADKNVIWYSKRSQLAGPLTQHIRRPALEIECGPKDSAVIARELKNLLKKILHSNITGSLMQDNDSLSQEYYRVYGKHPGEGHSGIKDFQKITIGEESFYPFLSANQYNQIACYKMEQIKLPDIDNVLV